MADYQALNSESSKQGIRYCLIVQYLSLFLLILVIIADIHLFFYHAHSCTKELPFHIGWYISLITILNISRARRQHVVFLRSVKYGVSILALILLSKVLNIIHFPTIKQASQCFALTVDEMIYLLIKRIFIVVITTVITMIVAMIELSWTGMVYERTSVNQESNVASSQAMAVSEV